MMVRALLGGRLVRLKSPKWLAPWGVVQKWLAPWVRTDRRSVSYVECGRLATSAVSPCMNEVSA